MTKKEVRKKVEKPEAKVDAAQAKRIVIEEVQKNLVAGRQEIDAILEKRGLEQQATVTIGRGFIEPRIVLIPRR